MSMTHFGVSMKYENSLGSLRVHANSGYEINSNELMHYDTFPQNEEKEDYL